MSYSMARRACICASISGSKKQKLPRVSPLARQSARSAFLISSAGFRPLAGPMAMPTEVPMMT